MAHYENALILIGVIIFTLSPLTVTRTPPLELHFFDVGSVEVFADFRLPILTPTLPLTRSSSAAPPRGMIASVFVALVSFLFNV